MMITYKLILIIYGVCISLLPNFAEGGLIKTSGSASQSEGVSENASIKPLPDEQKEICRFPLLKHGETGEDGSGCGYSLIGWHASDSKAKESIEKGIDVPLDFTYPRRLGFGFYVSDSAVDVTRSYASLEDPLLCAIYAPTELFQQWTKIYVPLKYFVTPKESFKTGSSPPIASSTFSQRKESVPLHFHSDNLKGYVKILRHLKSIPGSPEKVDSNLIYLSQFDAVRITSFQMVIPTDKFKYLKADCSPAYEIEDLEGLNLNWRSKISLVLNVVHKVLIASHVSRVKMQTIDFQGFGDPDDESFP
ncbi:hypothetical protein BKA69DRAFT_1123514 [Paraphysoderma sedebokerense]|nr:hypothetical protein BKA69DRAFT_1123514 [Paraphysoderma sedebokerense]